MPVVSCAKEKNKARKKIGYERIRSSVLKRMWMENLNEKKDDIWEKSCWRKAVSLTGIITAEGTAKLKTPPCRTHSAQLLTPYPSGLPLSLSHFSEPFLMPTTHSQWRLHVNALRASRHIMIVVKILIDNKFALNMYKALTECQALCWWLTGMISFQLSPNTVRNIHIYIISFYKGKTLRHRGYLTCPWA